MWRMQAPELYDDSEQEDDDRAFGEGEVLPALPQAYDSQRDEVKSCIG